MDPSRRFKRSQNGSQLSECEDQIQNAKKLSLGVIKLQTKKGCSSKTKNNENEYICTKALVH